MLSTLRRGLLRRSCGASIYAVTLCVVLCGCATSPLGRRTALFARAAAVTTRDTGNAYQLVERTYRDAQIARMVANYDEKGFDTSRLKPFLPEQDLAIRTEVLEGLRSYAELLSSVSGDEAFEGVDASATALGRSLQSISSNDLVAGKLTATDANIAATAIAALGHALVDRRRRRELPGVLSRMQQPIETICTLLEQDIGDPAHSGLRNELHISYLDLMREQKNYIAENGTALAPAEKRDEIRVLPRLAASESAADQTLANTQKALAQLAKTHTALATTAAHKEAPSFDLQMEQLAATAQQLQTFYTTLAASK